ncbi:MAG: hypothetical protein ACR2MP_25990 [Streptosporangiaceae bacterium]
MSNVPAVSMEDLELEHAELLPSRETLWVCHHPSQYGSNFSFTQVAQGNGNTNQAGFLNISALNGNLSGNSISL